MFLTFQQILETRLKEGYSAPGDLPLRWPNTNGNQDEFVWVVHDGTVGSNPTFGGATRSNRQIGTLTLGIWVKTGKGTFSANAHASKLAGLFEGYTAVRDGWKLECGTPYVDVLGEDKSSSAYGINVIIPFRADRFG